MTMPFGFGSSADRGGCYVRRVLRTSAEAALLSDPDRVELVVSCIEPGHYRVASVDGSCDFRRTSAGYETLTVSGRDPLGDQTTDRFLGLAADQDAVFPKAADNAYPYAQERIAQLFDHPSAPDLAVVRTAAFHVHGNLGEHGSLGAVQSRAANVLGDALDSGDVPSIAGVLENGTCYREGSIASLPSVTLPNHTTILTGSHPGHHGVLANQWIDRASGETHNLLEYEQMARMCDLLLPDVETLFEAVNRNFSDAFCAATYEYADCGANYSSFAELRAERRPVGMPRRHEDVPDATAHWFEENPEYHFQSRIDSASTTQACTLLDPAGETPAAHLHVGQLQPH